MTPLVLRKRQMTEGMSPRAKLIETISVILLAATIKVNASPEEDATSSESSPVLAQVFS